MCAVIPARRKRYVKRADRAEESISFVKVEYIIMALQKDETERPSLEIRLQLHYADCRYEYAAVAIGSFQWQVL